MGGAPPGIGHQDDGHHFPHHRVIATRFDAPAASTISGPCGASQEEGRPRRSARQALVLVALAAGTFVDDQDVEHALLGPIGYRYDLDQQRVVGERQRDGAWVRDRGPVNPRLSGVLTLVNLSATAVCAVEPTFWANPWAERPTAASGSLAAH